MNPTKMLLAIAWMVALAACSERGSTRQSGAVSISAGTVSASSAPGAPTPAAPGAATATPLPPGIVLTGLTIAVRELELDDGVCAVTTTASSSSAPKALSSGRDGSRDDAHDGLHDDSADDSHDDPGEGSHEGSDEGSGDDAHHGCEAELGPFVVRLDPAALGSLASGTLSQLWTAKVPAGTYTELEASLCAIAPSALKDETQAALAEAMGGASVVLEGTYQAPGSESAPVPFRISVNACAEIERHVNVVVDGSGAVSNLTLHVGLGAWFHDAQGAFIAPDTAAGAAAIAANIAASLDVYDDDDHDGRCDD